MFASFFPLWAGEASLGEARAGGQRAGLRLRTLGPLLASALGLQWGREAAWGTRAQRTLGMR